MDPFRDHPPEFNRRPYPEEQYGPGWTGRDDYRHEDFRQPEPLRGGRQTSPREGYYGESESRGYERRDDEDPRARDRAFRQDESQRPRRQPQGFPESEQEPHGWLGNDRYRVGEHPESHAGDHPHDRRPPSYERPSQGRRMQGQPEQRYYGSDEPRSKTDSSQRRREEPSRERQFPPKRRGE